MSFFKIDLNLNHQVNKWTSFIGPATIVVGKDGTCDFVVSGKGISRVHCRIDGKSGSWSICDLNSTNGTFVNGERLSSSPSSNGPAKAFVELKNGDQIQLGEVIITVSFSFIEHDQTEIIEGPSFDGERQKRISEFPPIVSPQAIQDREETKVPTSVIAISNSNEYFADTKTVSPSVFPECYRSLGDYRLERLIGTGGMGEVYLAHHVQTRSEKCAIKLLRPQSSLTDRDQARFVREMEITLQLQHPSLIRSMDCGEIDGQLFIAMEYCNGGNLFELLQRSGALSVRRAVRLADRLLAGIDHAHMQGIVHRDLKPSNVLLHRSRDRKYHPKISDFGLAKSYLLAGESGMTVDGSVGGSWGYMPREQLTNFRFVSPRSDVWSMGALLYECLTLQLPRPRIANFDPIRIILECDAVPIHDVLPSVPSRIAMVTMKSLDTDPSSRFRDAGEMLSALRDAAKRDGVDF